MPGGVGGGSCEASPYPDWRCRGPAIYPALSTGVFLAMPSGAKIITACLKGPSRRARLMAEHARRVCRWLRVYSWFIYRFTSPGMQRLLTTRGNPFRAEIRRHLPPLRGHDPLLCARHADYGFQSV